jgi:hypothetical protein
VIMKKILPIAFLITVFLAGFSLSNYITKSSEMDQKNSVEMEIKVFVKSINNEAIEGVELVLIGYDGEIIDILKTDSKGEVIENISIELDSRYSNTVDEALAARGTLTIVAFKEGYRETVLFEAGISKGSYFQSIIMNPIVEGERNEPDLYLGNSHHLEVISFVNKYARQIGREAKDY